MATKKVAGRVREHSPAVMFPQSGEAPESHGVNVAQHRRVSRALASRLTAYLPLTAVAFAVFGLGIMHDHELVGMASIAACVGVLVLPRGAR